MKSLEQLDDETTEESTRLSKDQGGFVLPWIALMLLVLIAMAGFGVDVWNWWYTAQKAQRAADAGALAGVPFMPANFNGGAPSATSIATSAVGANGFNTVTVAQGTQSNQLVVTVTKNVNNYFTSLLGLSTTTITRSATAEFNAPVQMGAPAGTGVGNDPENGATAKHWLNIGAPGVDKRTGDRFADYGNCSTGTYACTNGLNDEYSDDSYIFTVDVASVPAGGVNIQVYDPEYANVGGSCNIAPMTQAQRDQLKVAPNNFTDADTRFAPSQNDYCPGDDNTNLGTPQATAWLLYRAAANNPVFDSSSTVVSGCTKQFKGYNPPTDTNDPNYATYWFNLLNSPGDPDFRASFHQWYTLCNVTQTGRYFIRVRSSLPFGASSLTAANPSPSTSIGGQNRYSIRAVNNGTNTVATGTATYATTRLPVYTNTTGNNTPNFYLARMLPGGGGSTGRTLKLTFYDIGDLASGTNTRLVVSPPSDATTSAGQSISCSNWKYNLGTTAPSGASTSNCTLDGITSNAFPSGFNGVRVDVDVTVPPSYNCSVGVSTGCWFKIQMFYTGGASSQANDTTTWSATIGGDPVRLIK